MAKIHKPMLLFFLAALALAVSASAVELTGGWQTIAMSEDMKEKTISQLMGRCEVQVAWGAYSEARPPSPTEGKWVRLHWEDDSRKITDSMIGSGLWVYTPEGKTCSFQGSGYVERLGKAASLTTGWNFISVSRSMIDRPFSELKGCTVEKVRLYSPKTCQDARSDSDGADICSEDYLKIANSEKLPNSYLGKGLWVKASSDCALDDGPGQASCKNAECAAKSGASGADYVTYGCKDSACAETSRRALTEEEKANLGADLVPRIEIKPLTAASLEQIEAGDEVEIAVHIKNAGTQSTFDHAKKTPQQLSYVVKMTIEKISAGGATPVATETKETGMVDKDILPQQEVKAMSFRWKAAAEGTYRVKAIAYINKAVTELGEAAESNNEKTSELAVKAASTRLPDLVIKEGTISVTPKVMCRPTTVAAIAATVKNVGRTPAVAEGQFLEVKAYIKEDGNVVCSNLHDTPRILVTLQGQEERTFSNMGLKDKGGGACALNSGKDYAIAVEVDTLKIGNNNGAVEESNEENTFTLPIADEAQCDKAGERTPDCYCDLEKKPHALNDGNKGCTHNFECKTNMCIRGKCVDDDNAGRILGILGYTS